MPHGGTRRPAHPSRPRPSSAALGGGAARVCPAPRPAAAAPRASLIHRPPPRRRRSERSRSPSRRVSKSREKLVRPRRRWNPDVVLPAEAGPPVDEAGSWNSAAARRPARETASRRHRDHACTSRGDQPARTRSSLTTRPKPASTRLWPPGDGSSPRTLRIVTPSSTRKATKCTSSRCTSVDGSPTALVNGYRFAVNVAHRALAGTFRPEREVPTEAARMSKGVARPLSRPTHGEHHNHVRAHGRCVGDRRPDRLSRPPHAGALRRVVVDHLLAAGDSGGSLALWAAQWGHRWRRGERSHWNRDRRSRRVRGGELGNRRGWRTRRCV